jgi:hypothetical protein
MTRFEIGDEVKIINEVLFRVPFGPKWINDGKVRTIESIELVEGHLLVSDGYYMTCEGSKFKFDEKDLEFISRPSLWRKDV